METALLHEFDERTGRRGVSDPTQQFEPDLTSLWINLFVEPGHKIIDGDRPGSSDDECGGVEGDEAGEGRRAHPAHHSFGRTITRPNSFDENLASGFRSEFQRLTDRFGGLRRDKSGKSIRRTDPEVTRYGGVLKNRNQVRHVLVE